MDIQPQRNVIRTILKGYDHVGAYRQHFQFCQEFPLIQIRLETNHNSLQLNKLQ